MIPTLLVSDARTDLGPKGATGWTDEQREHLVRCIERGDLIAYWCSDQHGRPANHVTKMPLEPVYAGMVQELEGVSIPRICTAEGLHATWEPHCWPGCRVWVVALVGVVDNRSTKMAARRREIIGEVLPEYCYHPSAGVRIGCKDLSGANLAGANLASADLVDADLSRTDLSGANLTEAILRWTNLTEAILTNTDLTNTDLTSAIATEAPAGWKLVNGKLERHET